MEKVVEMTKLVYCRRKGEWREEQSMRDRQDRSPIDGNIIQPARILLIVAITAVAAVVGCISQPPAVEKVVLEVNPVIDYYPLGGFAEKSDGVFAVLKGSIPEVKESLKDIVIKKAAQPSTFSVDEDLNLVVMRGVFNTGGYGININRVERLSNAFTVYATYMDPGEGMVVTQVFTQPTAIIPVGKLASGDYKAVLKVTRMIQSAEGEKVIETEKEVKSLEFKVE
jgi:hypothetical protein